MAFAQVIGLVAAFLTTIAVVPQAIKTFKTRSAKDLSLKMLLAVTAGVFCWLIYGLMINDFPLIAANIVTFCLYLALLYFRLTYK
ncbi:PQ loop repeat protein [uncultured archaeon]|nr:PQ loop repeat protein [uncultured archaeon]